MYKEFIKDNVCFVVPNNVKMEILSYMSKAKILADVCFFSIEELKKNIFFDYDERSVFELSKKFNIKYEDSVLMINNMYYLGTGSDDTKINDLMGMKKYLDDNNFLYYNNGFLDYLNKKEIVTTYENTSSFNEKIFSLLNDVKHVSSNVSINKNIYEFNFIEDEVEYVAFEIAKLIDRGIDVKNIKLVNVSDEYIDIIDKIFAFYNIPIDLNKREYLYDWKIVRTFIDNLKYMPLEDALNNFKENNNMENPNIVEAYSKIISVMNKHYFIQDYSNNIKFIIEAFKKTSIREEVLSNCINCINFDDVMEDDKYYFLIGFNSKYPKFYKDEDFFSDVQKKKLGFLTSTEINKNIKHYYINKLNNLKNLTISYKLKDYFNSYLASTLCDEINASVVKNIMIDNNVSYSSKFDRVKLSKHLDNFYKFSYKDRSLGNLYKTYGKDLYNSFDNSFKGIDNKAYIKKNGNSLSLSYSSLDEYFHCGFKYYLSNLLNEKDDTFAIFVGNLFHAILSKMYNDNFDFEASYDEEVSKRKLSDKEEILLNKLKKELERDIDLLREQYYNGEFKNCICEGKIEIGIKNNVSIVLKGFIDKIMITSDNKYAYVVDYKSGNPKVNFDYLKDGLNMQLAIYMYLMNKSKDYADIFLVGCYLQRILEDDLSKDELKLDGFTFNDLNTIKLIDKTCFDKSIITGIKVKKDGSLCDSKKLFNSEYYEYVLATVEEKINEAIDGILNAEFKINPKIVKGANVSCKYCKYKDICYKKYKDSIVLSVDGDDDE